MTYDEVAKEQLEFPSATYEDFELLADQAIDDFLVGNILLVKLEDGTLAIEEYHDLLLTLFHQVYMSSSSFALAGTMVDSRWFHVREYLMEHAEEEKEHWAWIVSDLRATGYRGADPRQNFPSLAAQSYVGYAMYLGSKFPVGRLAMGYILEGLSGRFGVQYGLKAANLLKLERHQVEFFVKHGELDAGHSDDILEVLRATELTPYEWAHCCHVARTTVALYKAMYNEAVKSLDPVLVSR